MQRPLLFLHIAHKHMPAYIGTLSLPMHAHAFVGFVSQIASVLCCAALRCSVAPKGEGELDIVDRVVPFDFFCPQSKPFGVLKCYGHQHIGEHG
jgi:hypothetical protein